MMLRSPVLTLATIGAMLAGSGVQAQLSPCATDQVRQRLIAANPDPVHQEAQAELGLQEYLQMRAGLREDVDTVTYVLPMVFHILYDPTVGNDEHNISDAQIFDAVNILNRDYAKLNADTSQICCGYDTIAAKTHIRFQLATKDPFGNCTNGIDRITSLRSTNGADYSKLNPWFRAQYINVWVVRSLASQGDFSPAGYSMYPSDVQDDLGALRDGVIILHDYIGSIGTGAPFSSRALTHEIGHYLNLKHTWGSTNAPEVSCGDDMVGDTPVTKGHLSCNLYDSFCSAQSIDSAYMFTDVTTTSGTTDPAPATTINININDSTIGPALTLGTVSAVGVSANSSENGAFAFTQWGTGAQQGDSLYTQLTGSLDPNRYYEFTVTPLPGKSMSLSSIFFRVNRSVDGPRTYAVRSNAGGVSFTSNLPASVVPSNPALSVPTSNIFFFKNDTTSAPLKGTKVTLSDNAFQNSPDPITFRIYAWNAEGPDGSFTVDSLLVSGTVGVIENVQNYMEYSYCSNMFTQANPSGCGPR
jgi:hypothetical protein